MDADGRRNRFLLKGGHARWSPDGTRIAYIGAADDKAQLFVRWMDAEGAVTQITHDQMAPNFFVWSPDGQSIAFRAQVPMKPGFSITLPARPSGAKSNRRAPPPRWRPARHITVVRAATKNIRRRRSRYTPATTTPSGSAPPQAKPSKLRQNQKTRGTLFGIIVGLQLT